MQLRRPQVAGLLLCEAGADSHLFCRRCGGVVDELCHQVKDLQECVNRPHSIHEDEQEIGYSLRL